MSHVTWKAVFVLCLVKSGPLPHCSRVSQTRKGVTGKQCRPRSDAAKCQTRHLIRVSTVCKKFSHVSLGICKFHSRKYLKLKLVSSNIQCGRVYSVYNGITFITYTQDTMILYASRQQRSWSDCANDWSEPLLTADALQTPFSLGVTCLTE